MFYAINKNIFTSKNYKKMLNICVRSFVNLAPTLALKNKQD